MCSFVFFTGSCRLKHAGLFPFGHYRDGKSHFITQRSRYPNFQRECIRVPPSLRELQWSVFAFSRSPRNIWSIGGLPSIRKRVCKLKLVLRHPFHEATHELFLQIPVCQTRGAIQPRGSHKRLLVRQHLNMRVSAHHNVRYHVQLQVVVILPVRLTVLPQSRLCPFWLWKDSVRLFPQRLRASNVVPPEA